jgi:acyl carrier protein
MDDFGVVPDDAVELVNAIEAALNIEITEEEAEEMPKFRTMKEAIDYFRERRSGKGGI